MGKGGEGGVVYDQSGAEDVRFQGSYEYLRCIYKELVLYVLRYIASKMKPCKISLSILSPCLVSELIPHSVTCTREG